MEGYRLRGLEQRDVPVIAEMEKVCFTIPWSEQNIQGEYESDHAHWCVLELDDGTLAAYGGMWIVLDEAHVTNVAVMPDYRRRGYGRKVMEQLIGMAKELGATRMTLEVRVGNDAAKLLYFRLGFLPVGVRKGYYTDNGEDALILWKDEL